MTNSSIRVGSKKQVLAPVSRAAGTYNSDPYVLERGGSIIVTLIVTNVGGAGSVNEINIQAEENGNFDTIVAFTAQAIIATGRYRFRVAPAARAAGANAYKGVADDVVPAVGRVQVIHTVNAMIYSVKVEAIG